MVSRLLAPFLPYIAGAALLAAVSAAGVIWWQSGTIDGLRGDVARLERSLAVERERREQAQLAREVEAARAKRERARNAELSETVQQLREIPDAPLDPGIIRLLDGLRRD